MAEQRHPEEEELSRAAGAGCHLVAEALEVLKFPNPSMNLHLPRLYECHLVSFSVLAFRLQRVLLIVEQPPLCSLMLHPRHCYFYFWLDWREPAAQAPQAVSFLVLAERH